jgi:hypothetical protein
MASDTFRIDDPRVQDALRDIFRRWPNLERPRLHTKDGRLLDWAVRLLRARRTCERCDQPMKPGAQVVPKRFCSGECARAFQLLHQDEPENDCIICRVRSAVRGSNGAFRYCRREGRKPTRCPLRAMAARAAGFRMDHEGYAALLIQRRAEARAQRAARTAAQAAALAAAQAKEAARQQARQERQAARAAAQAEAARRKRMRLEVVPCPICAASFERDKALLVPRRTCGAPDCRRRWARQKKNESRGKRRQTERQAIGTAPAEAVTLEGLWLRADGRCQAPRPNGKPCRRICHIVHPNPVAHDKATIGHIQSLHAGGRTTWANCRLECRACNISNGAASTGNLLLPFVA